MLVTSNIEYLKEFPFHDAPLEEIEYNSTESLLNVFFSEYNENEKNYNTSKIIFYNVTNYIANNFLITDIDCINYFDFVENNNIMSCEILLLTYECSNKKIMFCFEKFEFYRNWH